VTRDEAIAEAIAAAAKAKQLAADAERDLTHPTLAHHVPKVAATSAAYADVSRAYTELAAVLPATPAE
jgi:hypothetical protein